MNVYFMKHLRVGCCSNLYYLVNRVSVYLKVIILGLLFASRIDLVTLFLNALYLLRSSVF